MKKEKVLKNNTFLCILGTTHKTDVIMDFIPSWIKNNPKGEMIVFDPHCVVVQSFGDYAKYSIDNDKDFKWVDKLLEVYKGKNEIPKLLILNGGDILFPKPKEDKLKEQHPELKSISRPPCPNKFMDLLAMRRLLNMDIIITFQTLDAMPIRLEYFVNNFIVLPILEEYELDKKSPNYLNLDTCIKTINYYHKNYGKDFKKEYLFFSIEKNEIIAIDSIDKKKFKKSINKFKAIKKRVSIEM